MKHRKWTAGEKLAIVLEGLKEKSLLLIYAESIRSARPCITDGGTNFLRVEREPS